VSPQYKEEEEEEEEEDYLPLVFVRVGMVLNL
jgi:hypothetical protein